MQHGDADDVVPLQRDIALRDLLTSKSVINSLITYQGYTHSQISMDSLVLARTRAWFELYTR
jgi:dipeptidyl aminopeptidase/acylaminoacyl peptidase